MMWKEAVVKATFVVLVVLIPVGFGLLWIEHKQARESREIAHLNCVSDNILIEAFIRTHPDGQSVPLLDCEATR